MAEYMETEYIKKPILKIAIKSYFKNLKYQDKHTIGVMDANADINRIISEMPAADVVEVVRCKDCVHCAVREYDIIDELECEFFDVFTDPLDYCSRGERKADNG